MARCWWLTGATAASVESTCSACLDRYDVAFANATATEPPVGVFAQEQAHGSRLFEVSKELLDHQVSAHVRALYEAITAARHGGDLLGIVDVLHDEILATTRSADLAELFIYRSTVNGDIGRTREAVADAQRAVDLLHQCGASPIRIARVVSLVGSTSSELGDIERSVRYAAQALQLMGDPTAHDDVGAVAVVTNNVGLVFANIEAWDLAAQQFRLSALADERHNDASGVEISTVNEIDALLNDAGHRQRANEDAGELMALAVSRCAMLCASSALPSSGEVAGPLLMARCLVMQGDFSGAQVLLDGLSEHIHGLDDEWFVMMWHMASAHCAVARNDYAAARRAIDVVVDSPGHAHHHYGYEMLRLRAVVLHRLGDHDEAFDVLARVDGLERRAAIRRVSCLASVVIERAQLASTNEVLTAMADSDPLTGALNRRGLERHVTTALSRPSMPVLVVDIDHFKAINDSFGHALGDRVLTAVTGAMRGALRHGDVLARTGGEEFQIVLVHASCAEAVAVGDRLRESVARYDWASLADQLAVTVSVGVALGRGDQYPQTVQAADEALYVAKRQGRNQVVLSDAGAPVGRAL
jgi:diguanylate cyclase (GGDEF)-like protein